MYKGLTSETVTTTLTTITSTTCTSTSTTGKFHCKKGDALALNPAFLKLGQQRIRMVFHIQLRIRFLSNLVFLIAVRQSLLHIKGILQESCLR